MADWRVGLFDLEFGQAEREAIMSVLDSGWLTTGGVTRDFEERFARFVGTRDAVAVASGTAALQLALLALDVGPGDEVICPALTFVATANAVLHVGATPVFADVTSTDDLSISPAEVERCIGPRTRAIVAVHYAGFPCDMDALRELGARHRLSLVEDAAHAPGAGLDGRACGDLGNVGCFSFYGNKNMTTGEGGMVTTNDLAVGARLRRLRSHGMTNDARLRHSGAALSYDVVELGHNFRSDELRSALGVAQLDGLPARNRRRAELAARYRDRLDGAQGIHLPYRTVRGESSHHVLAMLLPAAVDRIAFREALVGLGVQTTHHYPPIHLLEYYRRRFGYLPGLLPITEDVADREVTLPLHPRLGEDDLDYVCASVLEALTRAVESPTCASLG